MEFGGSRKLVLVDRRRGHYSSLLSSKPFHNPMTSLAMCNSTHPRENQACPAGTSVFQRPTLRAILILSVVLCGCGTTRMSDTLRTGTEQLLLSSAIDRSINAMDLSSLKGKDVYFDPQYLKGVSDEGYIVSSIRQRLLSEGVFLKASRDDATYVVEARAGAIGTNRQDVLLGIPQVTLPTGVAMAGAPSAIPEIPIAKKTHQKGVAKLAVFAYNQVTGQALWQSGTHPITADARDTWVLGTGPYQRGSIYNGTSFAGQRVMWPVGRQSAAKQQPPVLGQSVTAAASFVEDLNVQPPRPRSSLAEKSKDNKVTPALFTPAVPPSQPQPGRIPSPVPPSSVQTGVGSGFKSDTFNIPSGQDPKAASGGSAAAAGLMIFGSGTPQ